MNRSVRHSLLLLCFAWGATAQGAFAHEKWFHESESYPLRFDMLLRLCLCYSWPVF
jgi:hypothetical protein